MDAPCGCAPPPPPPPWSDGPCFAPAESTASLQAAVCLRACVPPSRLCGGEVPQRVRARRLVNHEARILAESAFSPSLPLSLSLSLSLLPPSFSLSLGLCFSFPLSLSPSGSLSLSVCLSQPEPSDLSHTKCTQNTHQVLGPPAPHHTNARVHTDPYTRVPPCLGASPWCTCRGPRGTEPHAATRTDAQTRGLTPHRRRHGPASPRTCPHGVPRAGHLGPLGSASTARSGGSALSPGPSGWVPLGRGPHSSCPVLTGKFRASFSSACGLRIQGGASPLRCPAHSRCLCLLHKRTAARVHQLRQGAQACLPRMPHP